MGEELEKKEEAKVAEVVDSEEKVEAAPSGSKGMSIAALVLGIISVVLFCFWYLAIPCAILAIIFGILGRKKEKSGMATAGFVLGIVAITISIIIVIIGIAFSAFLNNGLMDAINEAMERSDSSYDYNYNYDWDY